MPFINNRVLDLGLNVLSTEANRIDICHTLPTTYAQATSTYSVANASGVAFPGISAPEDRTPTGRQVVVSAITNGLITETSTDTTDDAEFWAIVDTTNSRLLAAGTLAEAKLVTEDNEFTLTSFRIGFPGVATPP